MALAGIGGLLGACFVFGQLQAEEINHDPAAKTPPEQAISDLELASDLAAYGARENDPLTLILAARIVKQTPSQVAADVEKEEDAESAVQEINPDDRPEQLLAQARQLAAGQDDILGLVTDVEQMVARGGRRGRRYLSDP